MTITLQVNELIQSLESAGELSIKETKVMALAKAYQQLAAENVAARNAVQVFCDVVGANTDAICEEVGPEGVRAILTAMSATGNMPVTDRIVAWIKAEAESHDLNAFISHYSAELDEHISNGGDQFDATSIRLRGFIVAGRMFREKLRDEDKALALREGAEK